MKASELRILAVVPAKDTRARYNYRLNYGLWDRTPPHVASMKLAVLECITHRWLARCIRKHGINCIYLPRHGRWTGPARRGILDIIRSATVPLIMFNNDDHKQYNDADIYSGMSFVFERVSDKRGQWRTAETGAWLPWSVDLEHYTPQFGGDVAMSMPCNINPQYPLRTAIAGELRGCLPTGKVYGEAYVALLQSSLTAVVTAGGSRCRVAPGKLLEVAACGAVPVCGGNLLLLDRYFSTESCYTFCSVPELRALLDYVPAHREEVLLRQQAVYEQVGKHNVVRQAALVAEFVAAHISGNTRPDLLERLCNPRKY